MKWGSRRSIALSLFVVLLRASSPALAVCPGDCNVDFTVTVEELVVGVQAATSGILSTSCLAFDKNGEGRVTIDELVRAVGAAQDGCRQISACLLGGCDVVPGFVGISAAFPSRRACCQYASLSLVSAAILWCDVLYLDTGRCAEGLCGSPCASVE
jgi:hypothetical protein